MCFVEQQPKQRDVFGTETGRLFPRFTVSKKSQRRSCVAGLFPRGTFPDSHDDESFTEFVNWFGWHQLAFMTTRVEKVVGWRTSRPENRTAKTKVKPAILQ